MYNIGLDFMVVGIRRINLGLLVTVWIMIGLPGILRRQYKCPILLFTTWDTARAFISRGRR